MLRKIFVTVAVALVGLVMFGGVSSADINNYEPDEQSTVGVADEDREVETGQTFDLLLGGFDPFETVSVSWSYTFGEAPPGYLTPSGLRSSRALRSDPENPFPVQVDQNGAGRQSVSFDQDGYVTFVARGEHSGRTNTAIVKIGTGGTKASATTAPTTTVAAGAGADGDGGSGSGSDLTYGHGAGSGLPNTGVSVAGPIAVGVGALLAGVLLLFFGTRGVMRHKSARSTAGM